MGSSGDPVPKKTYPPLFAPYRFSFLPQHFTTLSYALSIRKDDNFRDGLSDFLKTDESSNADKFLNKCLNRAGCYESADGVAEVTEDMIKVEK